MARRSHSFCICRSARGGRRPGSVNILDTVRKSGRNGRKSGDAVGRYRICVYAICKNEGKFVDRWMDSMGEADRIVVTDTGSDDGTAEKLRARGAEVYEETIRPWRFDEARNRSLAHVPEDADICVCTDMDEAFSKGWRACLERAWTPEILRADYLYNWSVKPDGTPDVQFRYSKVHVRRGFRWKYPVHETLVYQGKDAERAVFIEGMVLSHYPDPAKSRADYLPLLERAVAEDPRDDRMAYYLGREYMYAGRWQACIDTLTAYLKLDTAVWDCERSAAMRWIACSCHCLGRIREAYGWYYRAMAEAPFMRDPYVECAQMAYVLQDWPQTFCMVEEALKIPERSPVYVNMGYCWDSTPDDLGAVSCYRLGMMERAFDHARAALRLDPENKRLQKNLRLIAEQREKQAPAL